MSHFQISFVFIRHPVELSSRVDSFSMNFKISPALPATFCVVCLLKENNIPHISRAFHKILIPFFIPFLLKSQRHRDRHRC